MTEKHKDIRMTATEALERRIDELCVENEKLRQDTAKLRELVWDMWDFFCVVPDDPLTFKEELDFSAEVLSRMHELGIEVNE